MKKFIFILGLCIIAVQVFCDELPMALVYPGEFLGQSTKEEMNVAVDIFKGYLSKSDKLESIIYSVEMPSVLLAVKENKLSAEETALTAPLTDKFKVGKTLGYSYLFLPEVTRTDVTLEINVNTYNLKKGTMQSYGATIKSSGKNTVNDINSAMSGITVQILRDIFNETPNFKSEANKEKEQTERDEIDISSLDAKALLKLAEDCEKKENLPLAITYVNRAVDKSPDDPEIRLRLADLLYKKQLYKEALDQYYSAVNLGYRGEDNYKLKQKYEARVRAADYMKPVTEIKKDNQTQSGEEVIIAPPKVDNPAGEYDREITESINAADNLWKANKINDALKAYSDVVKKYPNDYRAYERLALVYANSMDFADSAKVLRILIDRNMDYSRSSVTKRVNTLSAVISGYYMKTVKQLRDVKANIANYTTLTELSRDLSAKNAKIYESMELINVLGEMSDSFYVTNLRLTGNLINSAMSGMLDYLEQGDGYGLESAEDCLSQAEIRIGQLKF